MQQACSATVEVLQKHADPYNTHFTAWAPRCKFGSGCRLWLIPLDQVAITADALRMRCRRLCERKASGKMNIDNATYEAYRSGGEQREHLEMALLECLARHGTHRTAYKKIKAHGRHGIDGNFDPWRPIWMVYIGDPTTIFSDMDWPGFELGMQIEQM